MKELLKELKELIENANIFYKNGQDVDIDAINFFIEPKVEFYENYVKKIQCFESNYDTIVEFITNDLSELRDFFYDCIDSVTYFEDLRASGDIENLPSLPMDENGNFINLMK